MHCISIALVMVFSTLALQRWIALRCLEISTVGLIRFRYANPENMLRKRSIEPRTETYTVALLHRRAWSELLVVTTSISTRLQAVLSSTASSTFYHCYDREPKRAHDFLDSPKPFRNQTRFGACWMVHTAFGSWRQGSWRRGPALEPTCAQSQAVDHTYSRSSCGNATEDVEEQ